MKYSITDTEIPQAGTDADDVDEALTLKQEAEEAVIQLRREQ